jgi:AcrR family transcriptional regulator
MTRERAILDAAAELFYESGFHGVGMDAIGSRAGLSGPAIYRTFTGKDEILATLLHETLDHLITSTAVVSVDPQQDLEDLVRHEIEVTIGNRHLISIYQREVRSLVEPWKRQFQRRMRTYAERWESAVGRRYPQASPESVVMGVQAALGLIHSVTYWPSAARDSPGLQAFVFSLALRSLDALNDVDGPAGRRGIRRTSSPQAS